MSTLRFNNPGVNNPTYPEAQPYEPKSNASSSNQITQEKTPTRLGRLGEQFRTLKGLMTPKPTTDFCKKSVKEKAEISGAIKELLMRAYNLEETDLIEIQKLIEKAATGQTLQPNIERIAAEREPANNATSVAGLAEGGRRRKSNRSTKRKASRKASRKANRKSRKN